MADSGTIGWKRLVVVTILATSFAIFADKIGLVNAIVKRV